jgi:hypothetical protein
LEQAQEFCGDLFDFMKKIQKIAKKVVVNCKVIPDERISFYTGGPSVKSTLNSASFDVQYFPTFIGYLTGRYPIKMTLKG